MDENDNTTYPPMSLPTTISSSSLSYKFNSSFFLFGLVNNVIYVVILSAALDLVDKNKTPKGLILLVNVLPSLMVKIGWPYFVTVSSLFVDLSVRDETDAS